MSDVTIRNYHKEDRSAVRSIAWDTAFMGEPASAFFASRETLESFLTLYFTDYEPESCFVAEAKGVVIGYLIGTKQSAALEEVFKGRILWPLLLGAIARGECFNFKNLRFGFHSLVSLFNKEFRDPDVSREYPATLHINLHREYRGRHIGSRLMSAYFDYLRSAHVRGAHLATMSRHAAQFFEQQGFILLHQGRRSYFRYLLKKDVPIFIYGKKL